MLNDHLLLRRWFLWPRCGVHIMPENEALEQLPAKWGFCQLLDLSFMFGHAFFDEILYVILYNNDLEFKLTRARVTLTHLAHDFKIFLARTAEQIFSDRFLNG